MNQQKIALVTGAAHGIGYATDRLLAGNAHHVMISESRGSKNDE